MMHSIKPFLGLTLGLVLIIRTSNAIDVSPGTVFDKGFIVEFENEAPDPALEFYQAVEACTRQCLQNVAVRPRIEFQSPLFRGASFNVTGHVLNATVEQIQGNIQSLSAVKKVWPILTYYPAAAVASSNHHMVSPRGDRTGLTIQQDDNSTAGLSTHIQTGVDQLHKEGVTGKGITIAIMDSGLDYLHPAFGSCFGPGCKVAYGYDFVGDDYGVDNVPRPDEDPYSECGIHGTHVAGIIGANPTSYGVVGVAPDATLNIYRVFGCSGGVETDVGVNASLAIFEHGADIITASLGGDGSWSEDPWAVVAQRINENGTLYIFANGNSGTSGPFTGNDPAGGIDVLAVGSANNIETPMYVWNGTSTVNGTTSEFVWTPTYPAVFPPSLNLYPLALDPEALAADACTPLPSNITDPDKTVVLAHRGRCAFDNKYKNLEAAGAKYVLFYHIDATPSRGPSFLDGHPFVGMGMTAYNLAVEWLSILSRGEKIELTMASNTTARAQVLSVPNNVSGGRMSDFSSWGPTFEAAIKPVLTGPGGNILSTLPRIVGSFGVLSGTSMSTPFIAGVAALMKQVNPSLSPAEINNLMATTAKPMPFNDNSSTPYDFLAPVFQQGGGMVDAYQAVRSNTILNVSSLAFNDTAFQPSSLSFTIQNNGDNVTTYDLSHIGAASLYTLKGDGDTFPVSTDFGDLAKGLTTTFAELTITPNTITVLPGQAETIHVSVQVPDLDPTRIPLYSGYVAINSTDGSQSLTLPYGGIATALKDIVVLDPSKNNETLVSYNTSSGLGTPVPANTTFTIRQNPNGTASSDTFTFPGVDFTLSFGTKLLIIDILDADTGKNVTTMRDANAGVVSLLQPKQIYSWFWNGTDVDSSFLPAGAYKWRVQVLRVTGDRENPDDFDSITTDPFFLQYNTNSSVKTSRKSRR